MAIHVFGIILIPLQQNKKQVFDYMISLLDLMDTYASPQSEEVTDYFSPHFNKAGAISDSASIISKLCHFPFFRSLPEEDLKNYVESNHIRLIKPKQYQMLFPELDCLWLVTSGTLILKSHEFSISSPELLARYESGEFIGFNEDHLKANNMWLSCLSREAEVLVL